MLTLCLFALGILAAKALVELSPETTTILEYADVAVCLVFLGDFVFSLVRAEDRVRYLRTWGWLDLLSSIPSIEVARWGRAARVLRVLRVLRGLRASQSVSTILLRTRPGDSVLAAGASALMILVLCSIAILHFESGGDGNIRSGEDAVWWALSTITTVGYGDRFPVTAEGRLVGAILMCAGVGLFGVLSGFVASWFIAPEERRQEGELAALHQELRSLRALLEQRSTAAR
jgi:voltage-gated potassium channel